MWKLTEQKGEQEMRKVFVQTLDKLMNENEKVIALEADLGGASGFSKLGKSHPKQFINVGIAEANMIGIAAGLSMRGLTPFLHTFAPFAVRRACDQIFLEGAYAGNTLNIYGSDPGVCAATNGGTHTTFEDLAVMRAIPEVEIYDPADGVQLEWLIGEMIGRKGVHYIRTTRKQMPDIYQEGSVFEIGKANVLREGADVLLIAAGLGLKPALDAAEVLQEKGIDAAVVDMFTIAPLDADTIRSQMSGKKLVVTVENHNITNGLG
ncbi:MAG: alpha-ketoacid dehydrogenase subunit beta, partial [Lachnospiraceae bacterium]|nr:alpha-ketoacid dehydrogenase subunit beta [Lachnospiraceae bacterium]